MIPRTCLQGTCVYCTHVQCFMKALTASIQPRRDTTPNDSCTGRQCTELVQHVLASVPLRLVDLVKTKTAGESQRLPMNSTMSQKSQMYTQSAGAAEACTPFNVDILCYISADYLQIGEPIWCPACPDRIAEFSGRSYPGGMHI